MSKAGAETGPGREGWFRRHGVRGPRRVRTPTMLQMEAVECGAAALGMVLAHHGRYLPLEELRVACGVSRDGVKASNIVRVAEANGLRARGFRAPAAGLEAYATPFIVFWTYNHFLVVEGLGRRWAYVNDPAQGRRRLARAEFDAGFSGIVLTFEPAPGFKPGGRPPSLLAGLRRRLAGSWHAIVFCVLVGLTLAMPGLIAPGFGKVFVDEVLIGRMTGWLSPLLLGIAATAALQLGLAWLQQRHLLALTTKLGVTMSASFLWHTLHLPAEFFAQRFAGDIAWRMTLNETVAQLLSSRAVTSAIGLCSSMLYLAAILWLDRPVGLACLGMTVAHAGLLIGLARFRMDLSQHLAQEQGKLMATTVASLQAIESVKADGAEAQVFARWAGFYTNVLNARQDLARPAQLMAALPPLLSLLTAAAVLVIGAVQVIQGDITPGTLVALQALAAGLLRPFAGLMAFGGGLQEVAGSLARLDDVLRAPQDPRVAAPRLGAELQRLSGRLELRGLTFGYSRLSPPLIEDFHLCLRPGQRVALVGPSGCGKSTVAKLVAGLFTPWAGEVLLDGRPAATIPRAMLGTSIAMVDQDILLFEGTVADNLRLWDATLPTEAMVRAARDAQIHAHILAMPGGYDAWVTERGRNLSGGEAQRLEIARALARDPALLILDEATSALDPLVELELDRALRRRGCACLIVAHRLSTIRDCDEIIVLDSGRIVQRGSHAALAAAPGLYADLVAA